MLNRSGNVTGIAMWLCTKSQAFERRRRGNKSGVERRRRGNRVARGERSVAPGLLQKSARALKERQKRMFVSHFQRSMEPAAIQGLRVRFAHTAPGYPVSAPAALQRPTFVQCLQLPLEGFEQTLVRSMYVPIEPIHPLPWVGFEFVQSFLRSPDRNSERVVCGGPDGVDD